MAKPTDYTMHVGKKYGTLTVILIKRLPGKVVAECLCDCGVKTASTSLARLISGKITTCKTCSNKLNGSKGRKSRTATSKYNDLIGKTINYFTVVRRSNVEFQEPCGTFKCQCVCGNIRFLDGFDLNKTSDRKSCGRQQSRLLSIAGGGTGIPYENETVNNFIRKSTKEYEYWVKACLSHSKFTCFLSGQIGGTLNVHHINPLNKIISLYGITKDNYTQFLDKLFDINNGVVLTEFLHRQLHNEYGNDASLDDLLTFKERLSFRINER